MAQTLSVRVQMEAQEAIRGAQQLGKAITDAGSQFSNAQSGAQKFSQEILQGQQSVFRMNESLGGINQSLPSLSSGFSDTGGAMEQLVSNTDRFSQGMQSASGETETFTGALGNIGSELQGLDSNLESSGSAMEQLGTASQGLGGELETIGTGMDAVGSASQGVGSELENVGTGMDAISSVSANLGTELETVGTSLETVGTATETATTPLGNFESQLTTVGTASTDLGTELDTMASGLETTGSAAETATSAFEPMSTTMEDLTSNFSTAGAESEVMTDALGNMGAEVEGVQGGLDSTNTLLGDYTASAQGAAGGNQQFGGSIAGVTGGMVGFAGNVNSAWQAVDNLIDSQNNVVRANIAAARATESARKAEVGLDNIMKTATRNTNNIVAARQRLAVAMQRVDEMQRAGISSGEEYEAAIAELEGAQAALTTELVAGGVAADKAEAAVNGLVIGTQRASAAQEKAAITAGNWEESIVGVAVSVGASLGTMISTVAAAGGKFKEFGTKLTGGARGAAGFGSAIAKVSLILTTVVNGAIAAGSAFGVLEGIIAKAAGESEKSATKFKEAWDLSKLAQGVVPNTKNLSDVLKLLGYDLDKVAKEQIEAGKASDLMASQQKTAASGADALKTRMKELGIGMNDSMVTTKGVSDSIASLDPVMNQTRISQEEFNKAMDAGAVAGNGLLIPISEGNDIMQQFGDAMGVTAEKALELSNLFPNMGSNIESALLAQEQGLGVAIDLWNDFNERVKAGQYEVGEFSKYIQDMGYELAPAIQQGVDSVDQIIKKIDEARNTIPGYLDEVTKAIGTQTTAYDELVKKVNEDTQKKNENAQATLQLIGTDEQLANVQADVNAEYAKSVDNLSRAQAVKNDYALSSQALETALNNELAKLIEQEGALRANLEATSNYAIQTQALTNAKLEGQVAAEQFVAKLDEEKAALEAQRGALAGYVEELGGLPGILQPTVENMEQFVEAQKNGGQAAVDFAHKVSEAYGSMLSDVGGRIDELAGIIQKGGEDMDESADAWLEGIPEMVRERLSGAQIAAIEGLASMKASIDTATEEFQWDRITLGLEEARSSLLSNLEQMRSQSNSKWQAVFSEAKNIAATGSEAILAEMMTVLEGGANKPPEVVLNELRALSNLTPPIGADAGKGIQEGMDPAAKEAGKSAAITLSEEFAAASTHIDAVLRGISEKMANLGKGTGHGPIAIDVDIAPAAAKLQSLVATMSSIRQSAPISVDADITPAANQLQSLVATISSIRQSAPIPIDVDITPAGNTLASLVATIASIKQGTPPPIAVNNAQAISQITVVQTRIDNIKQKTPPPIAVNNANAISQLTVVQTRIDNIKQKTPPVIRVNASQALSTISQVQSKLNSLKNINRTITYRYRTVGSPPAGARRYGGDFIMNGGAQGGASWVQKSSRTLGGVDIGEFNKPELVTVTPLTNPSDASDRTIDIPSSRGNRGGKGGGVSIGDTVVPVNIQIGNETIAKIVKRVAGNGREKFFR